MAKKINKNNIVNDSEEIDSELYEDQSEIVENLEENNNSQAPEDLSKFSKIKFIFKNNKKIISIILLLIFFFGGVYLIFFRKSNDSKKNNAVVEQDQKELNPYRINDNVLNELPEIQIKNTKENLKNQESLGDLLKNDNLLALKINENLKLPEESIKKITIQEKEEAKPIQMPVPIPVTIPKQPIQLPLPTIGLNENNQNTIKVSTENNSLQQNVIDESIERKINANVIVFAGSGSSNDKKEDALALINGKKKTKKTSFPNISESYIGLKDKMILAGKIIDLVLESSINTEREGMLRAIVSSDVYSESGFNILIPAGSRILGKYEPVLKYGNFRVNIMFNRVVRPDGVDIMLGDMKAVNKLGSSGVRADKVDNRIGSAFGNSMLIGALSLATLYASRQIEDLTKQDKTNYANTQGTSSNIIIINPGNNGSSSNGENNDKNDSEYGSATKDIIDKSIDPLKQHLEKLQSDKTPVLIINQGKKISIMTDKDIVFNDENAYVFYPHELDEIGIKN